LIQRDVFNVGVIISTCVEYNLLTLAEI